MVTYDIICEDDKRRIIRVYLPPISGSLSGHCTSYYELQQREENQWKKLKSGTRNDIMPISFLEL